MVSHEGGIAVGATALALVAMALTGARRSRVRPRHPAGEGSGRADGEDGPICSALAIVPGIATLWLGLPFILAGGGLALGLSARRGGPSRRATAAIILGALVQAVDKLA